MFKKIFCSILGSALLMTIVYADVTVANVSPMSQPKIGYFYSVSSSISSCENIQLQFDANGNASIPQSCLNNNTSTIQVYAENQPNLPITDASCSNIANAVSQIWVSYSAESITCQDFQNNKIKKS